MVELPKLRAAVSENHRKLQPYRKNTYEAVRQYVGKHYSDDGTTDRVPVNYLKMAVQIYSRILSARMPRVTVTTKSEELKVTAVRAEQLANNIIKASDLGSRVREWVESAMFGMGILKVGWAETGVIEWEDEMGPFEMPVGEVYAETILLDDWVQDLQARGRPWEMCSFMGHKYRINLEEAKERQDWDADARKALTESVRSKLTGSGDPNLSNISGGQAPNSEPLFKEVEVWEIYVPEVEQIITFGVDNQSADSSSHVDVPLSVIDWNGPTQGATYCGPYHFLGFDWPIGQSMPVPPVAHWRDMHELSNQLLNKNARKAIRQKTIFGYQSGHDEDARRQREAGDGEMVQMNDPNSVKVFENPGVDQQLLGYTMNLDQMMDKIGGNLTALGGLGPQSETIGQDQMALGQASSQLDDMKNEVLMGVGAAIKNMLYYWWNDPVQDFADVIKVTDTIEVPFTIPAETRGSIWHDLNFEVQPYSMRYTQPEERAGFVMELLNNPNFLQLLEMNEKMVNVDELVSLLSDYYNIPEITDLFVSVQGMPVPGKEMFGTKPTMQANTSRTYERVSRTADTGPSQQDILGMMDTPQNPTNSGPV